MYCFYLLKHLPSARLGDQLSYSVGMPEQSNDSSGQMHHGKHLENTGKYRLFKAIVIGF